MSIGEVSFYTGILLFLIGVIGGGVDIKEVKIPEIKGAPRYLCFIGSLVFLVLGLYLKNVIPPIAISNPVEPTVATTPAKVPELAVNPTPAEGTPTSPAIINSTASVTEPQKIPDTPDNAAPSAELIADKKAAQKELDAANKRIDVVWNSTTKAIRDELLFEQRQWIKKRETDCALEAATEEPNINKQDAIKLRCMAAMADPRIEVLTQKIAAMTNTESSPAIKPIEQSPIPDSIEIPVDPVVAAADAEKKAGQAELDDANNRLNEVWDGTTSAIQDELLAEQQKWLKKRNETCTQEANNEPNVNIKEAAKLHCMASITDQRTYELSQQIAEKSQ